MLLHAQKKMSVAVTQSSDGDLLDWSHLDARSPSCSLLAIVVLSLHSWEPGSLAADLHTTCEGQFSDTAHACMQDVTAKTAGEAGRKKRSLVPF